VFLKVAQMSLNRDGVVTEIFEGCQRSRLSNFGELSKRQSANQSSGERRIKQKSPGADGTGAAYHAQNIRI
jgi:hypothetical protein